MTLFVPGGIFQEGKNLIIVVELLGRSNQAVNLSQLDNKKNLIDLKSIIKFVKEPIYK